MHNCANRAHASVWRYTHLSSFNIIHLSPITLVKMKHFIKCLSSTLLIPVYTRSDCKINHLAIDSFLDHRGYLKGVNMHGNGKEAAYHEAGHAVINHVLNGRELIAISIVPTDLSGGRTERTPIADDYFYLKSKDDFQTLNRIRTEVIVLLAGNIAGEMATGNYNYSNIEGKGDFKKARELVSKAISLRFYKTGWGKLRQQYIEEATKKAKKLLQSNWQAVEALANALLDKKELSGKEATEIIKDELSN